MKQKLFLTSALAMGVFAPAFAEPSNTGTFPSTGLMQEDYTYTNAATAENMDSVYEGEVNAIAEYTEIPYSAEKGFYLTGVDDNNGAITAECTSGNFCPGVASTTYENNAFGDTGLQSCSTATSGAYTLSDAGASSQNDCYRKCTTADVEHSTGTMNGGYYYGNNNQCEPTACENGSHPKAAVPNLTNIIGVSEAGTKSVYKSINGNGSNSSAEDLSTYGIAQNGEFVTDYGNKGKIHGHAQCSTRSATNPYRGNNGDYVLQSDGTTTTLPDSSGINCYCQLDSYTTAGGNTTALSAPWMCDLNYVNAFSCSNDCAHNCAMRMRATDSSDLAFRAAVFGSISASPASCEANVININWSNADAADVSANNAGTATYGSDVRTPVKAQTKKGKTFRGWRFSKPQQTNLP